MKTKGMGWRARAGIALIALLAGSMAHGQGTPKAAPAAQSQSAPAPQQKLYKNEELDQMMAPVALYPDSLLAQLLMASTYPSDVTEAVKWSAAHKDSKGDAAVNMVENEEWDPSVKSLVAFPQVLDQLGKQPDWVQKTGDAFLAQPEDVMASIQRLRQKAQKAGNLKSNEQQKVVTKEVPVEKSGETTTTTTTQGGTTTNTTVIEIQPSNPETVYVPAYNPTTAYGAWSYPSYPPPYWPPSPYYYPGYYPGAAFATGVMWGIGIAAIGSAWGGFGWGHGDVDINVNKYNNINRNNQISNSGNRGNGNQKWNHNANNRRGTPYADSGSRQKYGQGAGNAQNRSGYRGDASRDASRQRAQQSFNSSTGFQGGNRSGTGTGSGANRGSGGANAANRGGGANAANRSGGQGNFSGGSSGSRPSSSSMSSGSRSNAFSGASSGSGQREASRGQSSQRSSAASGGRGAGSGGAASRSAPSRGGGGGGRGGGGGGRRR